MEKNVDAFLGAENHLSGLLTLTSRLVQDRLSAALRPLGVTYAQAAALVRLWRTPDGRLPQHTFVTSLALARPSGTLLLTDLERAGLVTRSPDPTDGRRQVISLTDSGLALETEVFEVISGLQREFAHHVDPDDLARTMRTLTQLLSWLEPAALAALPAHERNALSH
ncbi:MarR family transcriptional regulator [Streptomyces sp. SID4919]|uniref:MarR family winged helix-turn-helix transcriptional regulator n=1 Tax=Streptomyces TaxID=1883 RepID=UPI000C069742|nr:MarR family transcriptional regulator [Streptomyces sp. AmelKG-E11A]MYY09331.1 MarR family transcriptional regulator [Streptomyces sp. SID4919]